MSHDSSTARPAVVQPRPAEPAATGGGGRPIGLFDLLAAGRRWRAGGPGPKATLAMLLERMGEHTDDNGRTEWRCWPNVATLAHESEQGERTVRRHLADLELQGLIRRRVRGSEGGGRRSSVFVLNLELLTTANGQNGHLGFPQPQRPSGAPPTATDDTPQRPSGGGSNGHLAHSRSALEHPRELPPSSSSPCEEPPGVPTGGDDDDSSFSAFQEQVLAIYAEMSLSSWVAGGGVLRNPEAAPGWLRSVARRAGELHGAAIATAHAAGAYPTATAEALYASDHPPAKPAEVDHVAQMQAAARRLHEIGNRQRRGEACPRCADGGWTVGPEGMAVACDHSPAPPEAVGEVVGRGPDAERIRAILARRRGVEA